VRRHLGKSEITHFFGNNLALLKQLVNLFDELAKADYISSQRTGKHPRVIMPGPNNQDWDTRLPREERHAA
jgi:hypothetical protein